jgi:multidrug efflux system membrane fusion protein
MGRRSRTVPTLKIIPREASTSCRFGRLLLGFAYCLLIAVAAGCQANQAAVAPQQPPAIPVAQPVRREVTDYVDFTGRTEAVQSVDIRPRVTGYLTQMPFREGAEVKAGDLLFVVDPRPYEAQLDQAQGQVDLNKASLKVAKITLARDLAINQRVPNSISQQLIDQQQATVDEAAARLRATEKSKELYALNHEFTRVTSPIDGQISRYYLTLGNLVNQDSTLLTTVMSVDPIYAYFEMDEPTLLRIRRAVNEGKVKLAEDPTKMPVSVGLQGEDGFPHQGTINFVNNQVNPTTGSILVRGVFSNPQPKRGRRLLSPGMFVRVRLPIGDPHPALLVIDRAVGSDQGIKYVYVLDSESKIQYRRVTTGPLQADGLRVIEQGLEGDEWVAIGMLQQVRPRMSVVAEKLPMPTLGQPTGPGAEPSPPEARKTAPPPAGIRKTTSSPPETTKR